MTSPVRGLSSWGDARFARLGGRISVLSEIRSVEGYDEETVGVGVGIGIDTGTNSGDGRSCLEPVDTDPDRDPDTDPDPVEPSDNSQMVPVRLPEENRFYIYHDYRKIQFVIARDFWMERVRHGWRAASIVWLAGVRRVGKTTLAKAFPEGDWLYLNCDAPRVAQAVADPEFFFRELRRPGVIFDEIHQLPDPTRLLKIAADEFPRVKVLATGSSTISAARKFRDTLTGRKRVVCLRPVLFSELEAFGAIPVEHRLLRGGLPTALMAERSDPEFHVEWLDSHFARDVQELFGVSKRAGYLALIQILLRQSGGLVDFTRLARDTGLSRPTVMHYLEVCQTTLTVHLLRPHHAGKAREWTHQPKAYLFDTGFVCHARGWDSLRPEDCGVLWEHLVLDMLLAVEDPTRVHFWRDHQQREVDFVVSRGRDAVDAYECKWSESQLETRNLAAFRAIYPRGRNFLVVPHANEPAARLVDGLRIDVVTPVDFLDEKVVPRHGLEP